ncbi:hypothetical protein ABK040_008181 [Willaertia magna]
MGQKGSKNQQSNNKTTTEIKGSHVNPLAIASSSTPSQLQVPNNTNKKSFLFSPTFLTRTFTKSSEKENVNSDALLTKQNKSTGVEVVSFDKQTNDDYIFGLKIVIVGYDGVGKTTIASQLTGMSREEMEQSNNCPTSISLDFVNSTAILNTNERVLLRCWDSTGYDKLSKIRNSVFMNANAVFIVCDITKRKSFDLIPQILRDASQFSNPDVMIVFVATKTDLRKTPKQGVECMAEEEVEQEFRKYSSDISILQLSTEKDKFLLFNFLNRLIQSKYHKRRASVAVYEATRQ